MENLFTAHIYLNHNSEIIHCFEMKFANRSMIGDTFRIIDIIDGEEYYFKKVLEMDGVKRTKDTLNKLKAVKLKSKMKVVVYEVSIYPVTNHSGVDFSAYVELQKTLNGL